MAHLIKIGNSQGIRIPKSLIEQAALEGKELSLQVLNGGIFITPRLSKRQGWSNAIENILVNQGLEEIDHEWLDAPLTTDDELEW